jgi:putative two-component system response regulator
MDGFAACHLIKQQPATRLTPVILITGLNDQASRIAGIDAGADDFLNKPVNREELYARVRSLVRLKRQTDELESAESLIRILALTIDARDGYTEAHSCRISRLATAVGQQLDLDADEIRALEWGGYLHDVGKIGIPDAILLKPGALTSSEAQLIKAHTVIGDRLCGGLRSLGKVRPIIRHHHERLDGSGYPDRLRGDEIPLLAQIVSVADAFDAITTDRPYRAARSVQDAFDELRDDVARGLRRADVVEAFIDVAQTQ